MPYSKEIRSKLLITESYFVMYKSCNVIFFRSRFIFISQSFDLSACLSIFMQMDVLDGARSFLIFVAADSTILEDALF